MSHCDLMPLEMAKESITRAPEGSVSDWKVYFSTLLDSELEEALRRGLELKTDEQN